MNDNVVIKSAENGAAHGSRMMAYCISALYTAKGAMEDGSRMAGYASVARGLCCFV